MRACLGVCAWSVLPETSELRVSAEHRSPAAFRSLLGGRKFKPCKFVMNYLTDLDFGEAEPGGRYVLLSAFQTSPVPGKLTSAVALTIALRHLTQKQSVNS